MSGWIKIHRKLLKKDYAKDPKKLAFWILLLLKANHAPKKERFAGKDIICMPGQFTTGRRQLADEAGISESLTNRLLSYFEKTEQQIEQRTSSTNRLISIVNWKEYQYLNSELNNKNEKSEQQSEHTIRSKEEYSIVKHSGKNEKKESIRGLSAGEALYVGRYGSSLPEPVGNKKNDTGSKGNG